ncbi:vacuolar protein sorting-associated protein 33B [Scaptodrosophila lebanonensis]|uniref:Vacuolar protein sorting-associated protein 33B n=1 Tax=Drosophila lebanonensis TaxID=7225 RepID=A0A6J2TKC3_DROLE|nr:vacuolar protein sorting-associated protein 33B [Scaptodrosophila lebanonensis]
MDLTLTLDKKLQGFQLIAQEKLQAILCSIPGKKELILEPALIKPLEHVCTASWLKLKGIQRIYKHDAKQCIPRVDDQVHIYMIRSTLSTFQALLSQLQATATPTDVASDVLKMYGRNDAETSIQVTAYHIICVPSCYAYFQTLLEQSGLWGLVQLHHYNWDFIYLDQGVLSMELPNVFECLYLQQNTSPLPALAQSLRILQILCGRPELVVTFGNHSTQLLKMLQTLGDWPSPAKSEIGAIIIVDRDKDYASSLLTPAIYSGLLLEVFQQRAGEIIIDNTTNKIRSQKLQVLDLKTESTGSTAAPAKASSIRMNSACDEIYGDNRYKHFSQASSLVRAQAKALGLEVQKLSDMKLDEMHDYVARKLPKITEMKAKVLRHLNASEIVIEMLAGNFRKVQSLEEDILNNVSRKRLLSEIDELLITDGQRFNTLRLLCLLHLCAGILPEELQTFARNYCNLFGHQELVVFQQLAQAGLLPPLLPDKDKGQRAPTKLLSNLPLPKFKQTEFQANANRLKLLVSCADGDIDGADGHAESKQASQQACPSFVFNGTYIPLVAQFCSILLKSNSADELANKLSMVEGVQLHLNKSPPLTPKAYATQFKSHSCKSQTDLLPLRLRNLFVFVVGGSTYAEVGACDFVSKLMGAQITVASDTLFAGSDLIANAFPK